MATLTLYGLKNCDSCRKARAWLNDHGIEHGFHDLRADGLNAAALDRWLANTGWEVLLNRRSTSWRQLPEADREGVNEARARKLLLAHPTLVKRPLLEGEGILQVGFSAAQYATALSGGN